MDEYEVGARLGTDRPHSFFALAQRVTWGLSQPDLVTVDVPAALEVLLRRHERSFAAHLVAAGGWRGSHPDKADSSLARAKELATGSEWASYLLPTEAEWQNVAPVQKLHEVIPDRVWRVRGDFPSAGVPFTNASIATIVRTDDGRLVVINPIAFEPAVFESIRALGPVCALVTQGKAHSRFIEGATRKFPEAKCYGTTGHGNHPAAAHLQFDGFIDRDAPLPGEFVCVPVHGTEIAETLILHRPTRMLIVQDLIAHSRNNPERPFFSRLYSMAFGLVDRIGWHSYQPMAWSNIPRMQACLRRVLDLPFERVTGAHWPIDPEGEDTLGATRESIEWLLGLTPLAHKFMLARYFWAQPSFLRDLLKYKARSRKLAATGGQQPVSAAGH